MQDGDGGDAAGAAARQAVQRVQQAAQDAVQQAAQQAAHQAAQQAAGTVLADHQRVLESLAASMQALSSGSRAGAVADAKVKGPDVWQPKSLDEEVSGWEEWSFCFKSWLGFLDPKYGRS